MPGRWYAGTVVGRMNSDGALEVLVLDCEFLDPKYAHIPRQTKFTGGTEDGHPEDKNVLDTRAREKFEETGLRLKHGFHPRLILSKTVSPAHFKNFYFVWESECEGELRKVEKIDGNDKLSIPYWKVARSLVGQIGRAHV